MTDESPQEEGPGKTYRLKGALRPARHRFLLLGVLVVVAIAGLLTFLNEQMKEETAFSQQMQFQERSATAGNTSGLSYEEETAGPAGVAAEAAAMEPAPPTAETANPLADVSPEPTISAPPSE